MNDPLLSALASVFPGIVPCDWGNDTPGHVASIRMAGVDTVPESIAARIAKDTKQRWGDAPAPQFVRDVTAGNYRFVDVWR